MGESSDSVDFGDSGDFDCDSGDFDDFDVSGESVNFDESSDSENFVDSVDFGDLDVFGEFGFSSEFIKYIESVETIFTNQ